MCHHHTPLHPIRSHFLFNSTGAFYEYRRPFYNELWWFESIGRRGYLDFKERPARGPSGTKMKVICCKVLGRPTYSRTKQVDHLSLIKLHHISRTPTIKSGSLKLEENLSNKLRCAILWEKKNINRGKVATDDLDTGWQKGRLLELLLKC